MAEYYGVIRSPEYLMHYGVKGMRWGVQKAKESGNMRRLDRHYRRAMAKMKTLQDRTDINKQKKVYAENKAGAITNAAMVPVSVGLGFLGTHISKNNALGRLNRKVQEISNLPGVHFVSDSYRDYRPWGAITGAMYTGGAIGQGILAKQAKKRTTREGHEQAVKEANAWKREMNKAFAGTKYAKGASRHNNRKIKKLRFKKPNIELRSD